MSLFTFFLISIWLNSKKPWLYIQTKFKTWKSRLCNFQLTLHEKLDFHKFVGGANMPQKSAKEEEIKGKDCEYRICLPVYYSRANAVINCHLCPWFNRSLRFFCTIFAMSKFSVNQIFRAVQLSPRISNPIDNNFSVPHPEIMGNYR